ncbi:ergothioneine biosynthesis protein Egt2 [Schizosaccharomyces osmophilus]|uniref:Ergothioneine biosynthesis protein Egt2 n=1 Tax=Schizosaccharomyces osmophilus TaxID=2545709 RepID=A0AAE9WCK4_9SCHI|nr:ergothioneine biosynthesis protein Egt2 [Schizosaccharomyces osmophilus]WBW72687.1 ergothioneine biosynthesis protein Egt2 [Schizosaccharomyces osmophilus]
MSECIPFGRALKPYFMLDEKYVSVNNASSGVVCVPAFQRHLQLLEESEKVQDLQTRYRLPKLAEKTMDQLAELLDTSPNNLAFCFSATQAISSILLTFPWIANDRILTLNLAYPTCQFAVDFVQDRYDVQMDTIDIDFAYDRSELLSRVESYLAKNKPRLFIFDFVTSMPVIQLPCKELIQLCKKYNVISVIDAAHGIGLSPLSMSSLDPDFLYTNAHKWLNAPSGTTILYVSKKYHNSIEALPISYGYHIRKQKSPPPAPLNARFLYASSTDLPKFIAIDAAIAFRKSIGGEHKIQNYNYDIIIKGAKIIAEALGTSYFVLAPPIAMVNVEIPLRRMPSAEFFEYFWQSKNTFLRFVEYHGKFYTRIAGAPFLEESDFVYIAGVLKELCQNSPEN